MKEQIKVLMLEWFRDNDPHCVTEGGDYILDRDGFSLNELADHIAAGLKSRQGHDPIL